MVVLPPRLFPGIGYYRSIASSRRAIVDTGMRYDKRCKAVHRYEIVDARGRLQLTVPLAKPHGCNGVATWSDALVSTHDEWWRRHRTALESAYGRTPYFEFLIDRFNAIFRSPEEWPEWPSAIDLVKEANRVVCEFLELDDRMVCSDNLPEEEFVDLRIGQYDEESASSYWQVRQDLHGFQSGLSILDLVFNLGPEAIYLVHQGLAPRR